MKRRPPRSTRTDTLFPYTTLFRSADGAAILFHDDRLDRTTDGTGPVAEANLAALQALDAGIWFGPEFRGEKIPTLRQAIRLLVELGIGANIERSEERRVGKECVSTCRSWWSPYH